MPVTLNISITATGSPSPDPLTCAPGTQITWTNNNAACVSAFTLPTAVAPQTSPAPIAPGATTGSFTVNSGAKGNYGYSYVVDSPKNDTKGGTISVT